MEQTICVLKPGLAPEKKRKFSKKLCFNRLNLAQDFNRGD
jgi:hypothetical protein